MKKSFLFKIAAIILSISMLCSCTAADLDLASDLIDSVITELEKLPEDKADSIASTTTSEDSPISSNLDTISDTSAKASSNSGGTVLPEVIDKDSSNQTDTDNRYPDISSEETPVSDSSVPQTTQNNNAHKIRSYEDLKQVQYNVKTGYSYSGETITLECDIDLLGIAWQPIGTYQRPFKGKLNGNGHKISNLTISSSMNSFADSNGQSYVGFFGCAEDAVIEGLHLENISFELSDDGGADFAYIGGICGFLFGRRNAISITDCSTSGNISVFSESNSHMDIGGILGAFDANMGNIDYNMQWLYSTVNIKSEGYWINSGGISGSFAARRALKPEFKVSDMIYKGNIDDEKVRVPRTAGIFGSYHCGATSKIENCFVSLGVKRTGNNQYTEIDTHIGLVIGDEAASCAELSLSNIYGQVICGSSAVLQGMLGRAHSSVYFNKCFEVSQLPSDVPFDSEKWNLSDLASPVFYP